MTSAAPWCRFYPASDPRQTRMTHDLLLPCSSRCVRCFRGLVWSRSGDRSMRRNAEDQLLPPSRFALEGTSLGFQRSLERRSVATASDFAGLSPAVDRDDVSCFDARPSTVHWTKAAPH